MDTVQPSLWNLALVIHEQFSLVKTIREQNFQASLFIHLECHVDLQATLYLNIVVAGGLQEWKHDFPEKFQKVPQVTIYTD
jgi:hypothetical protein